MELPKLNYEDFYKFLISIGLILVVIAIVIILFLINNFLAMEWTIATMAAIVLLIIGGSIFIIIWAGKKWYKNQTLLDKKLESEVKLIEHEASQIIGPLKVDEKQSAIVNIIGKDVIKTAVALVSYKIAAVLPNSAPFNFLKDWKVWFWIANHDQKKYKAYVKIKFISAGLKDGLSVRDGYYGGNRAWKLDALSGIQAPGLEIPEEVKAVARKGERIKIEINCEIKDENDNLIEKKFPQTYVYDSEKNYWFLEP
jgi:hypothetical protein